TADELVPRPAPVWPGLLLALALTAGGWAVLDPASPGYQPQLGVAFHWGWFAPYAVAAVGGITLLVSALWDLARVRGWVADRTPDDWAAKARRWCEERVPVMSLPQYTRAEVAKVREELTEVL